MIEKQSYLEIEALSHGGYVIRQSHYPGSANFASQLVATSTLDEALRWLRENMVRRQPELQKGTIDAFAGIGVADRDPNGSSSY